MRENRLGKDRGRDGLRAEWWWEDKGKGRKESKGG